MPAPSAMRRWWRTVPPNERCTHFLRRRGQAGVGDGPEPEVEIFGDGVCSLDDGGSETDQHEGNARIRQLAEEPDLLLTYGQAVRVGHVSYSAATAREAARSSSPGHAPRPPHRRRASGRCPLRSSAARPYQGSRWGAGQDRGASTRQHYSPRIVPRAVPASRMAGSRFSQRGYERIGRIIQESGDPSGSRFNLRLEIPLNVVALRAA
jgi:hypothetical protein